MCVAEVVSRDSDRQRDVVVAVPHVTVIPCVIFSFL